MMDRHEAAVCIAKNIRQKMSSETYLYCYKLCSHFRIFLMSGRRNLYFRICLFVCSVTLPSL